MNVKKKTSLDLELDVKKFFGGWVVNISFAHLL